MKKIDCSTAQSWMIAHLDDGLDALALDCLQGHIEGCPACRRTYDATVKLFSRLRADAPPDPGEIFWARYDTSLKALLQEHDLDRERRTFPWRAMSALLVAGVIVVAVALEVVNHLTEQTALSPKMKSAVAEELSALYGPTFDEEMNPEAGSNTIAAATAGTAIPDSLVPWFEVEEDAYPLMPPDREVEPGPQSSRSTSRSVASAGGAKSPHHDVPLSGVLVHRSLIGSKTRQFSKKHGVVG